MAVLKKGNLLQQEKWYCDAAGKLTTKLKKPNSIGKNDTINGQINIGFIETTMALKGPGPITEVAEKFPLVDINFTSAMSNKLTDDVLNFKCGFYVLIHPE